jgi:UDP-N-acetylglucosamine acyltransferase
VIHSTAIIDPQAMIAEGVSIGAYAVIGPSVEIESGSHIGDHSTIYGPTRIGHDNQIYQHTTLGGAPQDLDYKGEPTRLEIGDRNTIREYTSISRGSVAGGGITQVGSDNYIMAYAHIGHDCQVGNQNILTNSVSLAGHVEVGDQCNLGGFSLVHQFVRIGSYAFSSMGSVINRDVPPFVRSPETMRAHMESTRLVCDERVFRLRPLMLSTGLTGCWCAVGHEATMPCNNCNPWCRNSMK